MSVRHKIHYYITQYSWLSSMGICGNEEVKHITENKICVTCKDCLKILMEKSE